MALIEVLSRLDLHWTQVAGVSCAGFYIALVHNDKTREGHLRIAMVASGAERWRLSAEMPSATARSILKDFRHAIHAGRSLKPPMRKLHDYAGNVMSARFKEHRKRLESRVEERILSSNPRYGVF